MPRITPLSDRTHISTGHCSLCGGHGKLTGAHIPPKAAYNDRPFRRGVWIDGTQMGFDSGRDGGMALYGHCEECRRTTSPWDDEYIRSTNIVISVLRDSPLIGMRSHVDGTIAGARPGRFARAALAGRSVLAERIWETDPDFVRCVRTGQGAPSGHLRFLVGVTTAGPERVDASGTHGGVDANIPLAAHGHVPLTTVPMPSAVVHHPPFSLLIVDASIAPLYPHVDCTEWLSEGADDAPRDLKVRWPVVHLPPRQPGESLSVPGEVMWPEKFEAAVA